jgi:hypothetical protein
VSNLSAILAAMETPIMSSPSASVAAPGTLTPRAALWIAWRYWFVLLVIPFLLFLAAAVYPVFATVEPRPELAHRWFIFTIIWTGVSVPAAFFVRERLFRDYWEGRTVEPGRYLAGMLVVWLTIESVGLISLAGCFVSGSLLPDLIPGLFAFVLFLTLWPTGEAMTTPVGAEDDSAVFRHPR